ncbi:expressed unknown protein [Seminavis robusta]|uniref:Uncharacterized protein n=1 Tax=Seminavis robusta TaxID=568900 RepID=A0A9N8HRL4_9STRA|nr:expressed unknown protein [Seminavis robusta]|eukprot:Sro1411_g270380.1 n/a (282) ;mRNA; r:15042-15887
MALYYNERTGNDDEKRGQMLSEWKHPQNRRSSLAQEGRTMSDPMMLCEDDTDSEDEDNVLSKFGTSMRSFFADDKHLRTPPPLSKLYPQEETKEQVDLGVVTYLGKQYSARDVFERCNSRRSLSSQSSSRTLQSLDEQATDLRSCLVRGLSNLVVGGGDEANSTASSPMAAKNRAQSPPRERPSQSSRRNRPKMSEVSVSADGYVERDEYLDMLSVDQEDLLDLADDPTDFAALKLALKKNGAITNTLLQQGLHVFVHKNRELKQRQSKKDESAQEGAVSA